MARYAILNTNAGVFFNGWVEGIELYSTTADYKNAFRFETPEVARAVCRDLNSSDSNWLVVAVKEYYAI